MPRNTLKLPGTSLPLQLEMFAKFVEKSLLVTVYIFSFQQSKWFRKSQIYAGFKNVYTSS